MPIIVTTSTTTSPLSATSTTVQNILDACAQDAVQQIGAESPILLDYVERTSKRILRETNAGFLLSAPQEFCTQKGITGYWIGASGSATAGTFDTALSLTDFGSIAEDTVFDRTNQRQLARVRTLPNSTAFEYADGSPTQAAPREWQNRITSPYVLSLYPAPDNQNTYQPVPLSPLVTTVTSGALAARTYYVKQTFVDSASGESTASAATRIYVPANKVLKVRAPQPALVTAASGITYSSYRVYVGTTEGSETLQSVTTSTGSDWTEPGTGLVAGAALPTSNALEPVRGYVIEFRYFKTRIPLTGTSQVLQIPDDYKDIVVAGVNEKSYRYLKNYPESSIWGAEFRDGLRQITRDRNSGPKFAHFMRPDKG